MDVDTIKFKINPINGRSASESLRLLESRRGPRRGVDRSPPRCGDQPAGAGVPAPCGQRWRQSAAPDSSGRPVVPRNLRDLSTQRGNSELVGDWLGQRTRESRSGEALRSRQLLQCPAVPRTLGALKLVLKGKAGRAIKPSREGPGQTGLGSGEPRFPGMGGVIAAHAGTQHSL